MKIKKIDGLALTGLVLILVTMFSSPTNATNVVGFNLIFTLVGFLLIDHVLRHFEQPEEISVSGLFQKGVQLFLPPLLFLCAATVVLAFWLTPSLLDHIIGQLLATLGLTSNFYGIKHALPVGFAKDSALFFHTWPISICGQYLIGATFVLALLKKIASTSPRRFKMLIVVASFITLLAGLCLMVTPFSANPSPEVLYYSSFSYLFAFALGGLVRCLSHGKRKLTPTLTSKILPVVMVLILLSSIIVPAKNSEVGHLLAVVSTSAITGLLLYIWQPPKNSAELPITPAFNLLILEFYLFTAPLFLIYQQSTSRLFACFFSLIGGLILTAIFHTIQVKMSQRSVFSLPQQKILTSSTLLVICLLGVLSIFVGPLGEAPVKAATTATSTTSTASATTTTSSSVEPVVLSATEEAAQLQNVWQPIIDAAENEVAIAIYSPATAQVVQLSNTAADATFETASIVKVPVLAELLLKEQAGELTLDNEDEDLAQQMIKDSSNYAATTLINKRIGGNYGIQLLFNALGMTNSHVNYDAWGLTQTTAADQITLLKNIFCDANILSADSQTYIKNLMSQVGADQKWGVSSGAAYADLKNGWLNRDDGTWVVNSIGHIYSAENAEGYVMAILSKNNASEQAGIDLLESLAQVTTNVLLP